MKIVQISEQYVAGLISTGSDVQYRVLHGIPDHWRLFAARVTLEGVLELQYADGESGETYQSIEIQTIRPEQDGEPQQGTGLLRAALVDMVGADGQDELQEAKDTMDRLPMLEDEMRAFRVAVTGG